MLLKWEQEFPGRVEAIFSSICNVSGSQLADLKLFDFAGLEERRRSEASGVQAMSEADEERLAEELALGLP
jgi:tRNA 2-thiocytidine biosynthesis protein TtcA